MPSVMGGIRPYAPHHPTPGENLPVARAPLTSVLGVRAARVLHGVRGCGRPDLTAAMKFHIVLVEQTLAAGVRVVVAATAPTVTWCCLPVPGGRRAWSQGPRLSFRAAGCAFRLGVSWCEDFCFRIF
eukprot:COSAG02_NODE_134_length_34593_cov_43.594886_6_plen_127_part_00